MVNIPVSLALWIVSIIEFMMVVAAGTLIFVRSRKAWRRSGLFETVERGLFRFAQRQLLAVAAIGLLALGFRAALIPILGIPVPGAHDEFSYALAADTFVSGRVTNPTHPMWTHFETFHVIQQPTYMSMYPPAQGLVLAVGRLLGNAWLGQWLITAAMCAAICWMLQAWVPPAWAFFGGVLAVLRLGILSYWMNGYWSASVVALGGALVFGALPRIKKKVRSRDAIVLAIGLVILANSRPYEGFVLSLPVLAAILVWIWKQDKLPSALIASRVVLPLVLILGAAGGAMGYYNYRVTGSPVRMPYEVNRATYATAPYFIWSTSRSKPVYRHAVMASFYDIEQNDYEANRTALGFLSCSGKKLLSWWGFYLGPALTIPILALPWLIRDKKMRFPIVAFSVFVAGLAVETFMLPHYFAPATCLVYLFLIQAMRHLRLWRWEIDRKGLALVCAIPAICIGMIILRIVAVETHTQIEPAWPRGNLKRVAIMSNLDKIPGGQLVLVRYARTHNVHNEYVYNSANIDQQKVVWARDMGEDKNQELVNYYGNRQVWLLEPDSSPMRLQRYPVDSGASRSEHASRTGAAHDLPHTLP